MDFHGHINLQDNQMRKMALSSETDFPSSPVVGRFVFKDFTLYMCVELNGAIPIWIPITNTINTYKHEQSVAAVEWVVKHNLTSTHPIVQIYDENNQLIIPDSIRRIGLKEVQITFSTAITGKVVVLSGGDEIPADGIGILAPDSHSYVTSFTSQTTVVAKHNLGYYPITRVFVGGVETAPQDVVHDSIFQTTITFASAQTGVARFV